MFLHDCANAISSLKGPKGLHLFVLVIYLHKKNSVLLQKMQPISILSWVVTIGLVTSRLPPLQHTFPITTTNLVWMVGFWHGKIQLTYYKQSIFDMGRFWHLAWANLMSYKFFFFFFLIPLEIFQIFDVFIHKILQD